MSDSSIQGVLLTPLKHIPHPKGDLYHGMRCSDPGYNGFGEAYFSTVNKGDVKPWKKHLRMTLNLVVPVGKIRFVILDMRDGSVTFGGRMLVEIGPENYQRLTVPPGLWMAFEGMNDGLNLLLNMADLEHDPGEMERVELDTFEYPGR
jgi:dTDP-4-dehydrorhamnose 3,5-epimerase